MKNNGNTLLKAFMDNALQKVFIMCIITAKLTNFNNNYIHIHKAKYTNSKSSSNVKLSYRPAKLR